MKCSGSLHVASSSAANSCVWEEGEESLHIPSCLALELLGVSLGRSPLAGPGREPLGPGPVLHYMPNSPVKGSVTPTVREELEALFHWR